MTETSAPTDVAAILAARPEIGEKLRERANVVQFIDGGRQQMENAISQLQYLNAFLEGAGVPLDTPVPEAPEPQRNRAEKRAARRKPVKRAAKKRGPAPSKKPAKLAAVPTPE